MMDASTLGKIDVRGPDALELLERLYCTDLASLAVGRGRYALMCRADGMLYDDGVVLRLGEHRYVVTTTTGNAAGVLDWMEEWLQTEWPDLRVWLTSVTEQWATAAVAGPRSRDVLAAVAPDLAVGRDDLRFMAVREARVAGVDALVARVSFSGELAYEVWAPSDRALHVWEALWAAGEAHGIEAYGTESMHVLRAEKGYVIVGQETDGTVTPVDLGLDWLVSTRKAFVGRRSLRRPDATRPGRKQLVALLPEDRDVVLAEGAQLTAAPSGAPPVPMLGHVTSSYESATLGRTFALALLGDGRERHGDVVYAHHLGTVHAARVADPVLYDPEGTRRDGD
jgi:sarcosine oxidase subunit alpha